MKKLALIFAAIVLSLAVYAFRMLDRSTSEALQALGIPEQLAKDHVWWSFSGGYFSYPYKPQLKQTPVSERATLTKQLMSFARNYTESKEFEKKYLEYRDQIKPTPPEKPQSMEQMRKTQKEDLLKSIRETEQSIKSLPADQQAMMKETIAMLKEQAKTYDDPDNPIFSKEVEEMYKQNYENELAEYKTKLSEWETNNPNKAARMIRQWLEGFLDVSKDVDFKAALTTGENSKKVFVNPAYESKSANWKLCYRAGKESVEAARVFTQQWLAELSKSK